MVELTLPGYVRKLHHVRISHWFFEEGDRVEAEANLVEINSDEGHYIITSPCDGIIEEVYFHAGDDVASDDVLGLISKSSEDYPRNKRRDEDDEQEGEKESLDEAWDDDGEDDEDDEEDEEDDDNHDE